MQQQILLLKDGTESAGGKLPITDVATKYFADRDMFCAGQVQEGDLNRTMKASGGAITSTVHDMNDITLRSCETFEESPKSTSCTIILRGGAEQFMEETERSLHDSIMIFPIFQFLVRFNTEGILMFDRFKVATAGYNKELCRTLQNFACI